VVKKDANPRGDASARVHPERQQRWISVKGGGAERGGGAGARALQPPAEGSRARAMEIVRGSRSGAQSAMRGRSPRNRESERARVTHTHTRIHEHARVLVLPVRMRFSDLRNRCGPMVCGVRCTGEGVHREKEGPGEDRGRVREGG
jgi:hypothetical protein